MKVGIGWPMTMNNQHQRDLFLQWCERADEAPFSSINIGDRIAYHNQEAMVSLGMAAGVTKRIALQTSVIAMPARNTGMFAKQVLTLDVLSGGRFTLGVGISSRPDDFKALDMPWEGRVERFEQQISDLRKIWAGKPLREGTPGIGPPPLKPGGPKIIYGAITDTALERAGRIADGIMTWSFKPDAEQQRHQIAVTQNAWKKAGRVGSPYICGAMYFCLGDDAEKLLAGYLKNYYGYSPDTQEQALLAETCNPKKIRETIKKYEDVGVEEIIFSAADPSLDQLNRLADLVDL